MRKLIFILIFNIFNLLFVHVYGQNFELTVSDSIRIETAKLFLSNRLGSDFVKDSVVFSGKYQTVLDDYAFEIVCGKNKYKNVFLVSFSGQEIETKYNSKICRADIIRYNQGLSSSNILYNQSYAKNIAVKIGFERGIKDWIIVLKGVADDYSWDVRSIESEQVEHPHYICGKVLIINSKTAKYSIARWSSIE